MKKFLIPAIALATLASCGGGSGTTQQNADSTAAGDGGGTDAINRVSTNDAPAEPDELTLITCEMLKYIKPQTFNMRLSEEPDTAFNVKNITDYPRWTQDSPDPKTSREDSSRFYVHLDGGFDNIWKFTYRKRKSGGYWILVHLRGLSGDCGDCEYNEYNAWYYVDGKPASSVNVNDKKHYAMPNPSILTDFYANLDKFPEKAREWLKNREITKFDYEISGDKINVTLNPYCHVENIVNDDYVEIIDVLPVLPRQLMGLEKKKDPKFPSVTYLWNGDDYIMDPKHKPLQEDLKYFQPDGGEKFAQSGKYAIQLYSGWDSDNYSEADINGDGMDDLVVCDNDYKEFAVYFKDKKGVYNRQMIGRLPPEENPDDECQLYTTAKQGGINVNASYKSTKEYDFHYEKGDFYLYKYMEWPDDGGSDYYEIDFGKHKVIDNDSTYSVPAYPLKKIDEVPLGWWTITDIYMGCDLTEIWKQIESRPDDVAGSKELKYSRDNLEYSIDVNDGHCSRCRTIHCYERKDKNYTVIDVYGLMCETQSGTYNLSENTITQYIFKDGKLTKTELQEELKPYSKDGFQTVFENVMGYGYEGYKLQFLTNSGDEAIFEWNGEKFVKK